ncbi:MAG: hypothetical protein M1814_006464 [Vezdaea aestivalis]|nr:MAG: hypothetical protein M1814_006464 [Vezdaea aestivalis]
MLSIYHSLSLIGHLVPLILSTLWFIPKPASAQNLALHNFDGFKLPTLRLPAKLPINFANLYPEAVQNISDPATTLGLNIAVPLPTLEYLKSKPTFFDGAGEFLKTSLPSILAQFNVPADQIAAKTDESIPVLLDLLKEIHADLTPSLTPRGVAYRRNLFTRIGKILGDIACGVAGAAVGPASFLFFSSEFSLLNSDPGVGLTDDQQYFVHAVHGDIATSAPVQIYYQATRPLGFTSPETVGTTFNKKWYTYLPNAPWRSDPRFEWMMQKVILHEFQHVVQYRAYGYSLIRYGDKYSFEVCKEGYNNMFLENEARSKENAADQLLTDPKGKKFFDAWAARGLRGPLGFPTRPTYTAIDGGIVELPFQNGVIQLDSGNQWRSFTTAELSAKAYINCKSDLRCRHLLKPRAICRTCDNDPGPNVCIQRELDELNKECVDKKREWNSLLRRPFSPI